MKRGQRSAGFTIIETMIVLAVTAALFLLAVITIAGRQNETEFQQAINDAQSNVRKIINQITSGDYQTASNLSCIATPGGLSISQNASPTSSEGGNTGCEYLGKAVQFGLNSNTSELITYPIAGIQCLGGTINGSSCDGSIDQTKPAVVAPASSSDTTTPDTSSVTHLAYGLSVVSANYVTGVAPSIVKTPIGAVGFISGVGSYSGGQLASGTQQIALVPILGTTTTPADAYTAVSAINSNLVSSYDTIAGSTNTYSVQLCLASGTTKESGLITIGVTGSGSIGAISTKIFSNKTCT